MSSTGIALYLLHHYGQVETPYGLRANSWGDSVKLLHNMSNFIFIFSIGLIFNEHIYMGLKGRKIGNKFSGYFITLTVLILVITGTLLLYLSSVDFRTLVSDVHSYVGFGMSIGMILHVFKKFT